MLHEREEEAEAVAPRVAPLVLQRLLATRRLQRPQQIAQRGQRRTAVPCTCAREKRSGSARRENDGIPRPYATNLVQTTMEHTPKRP
eukprot:6058755-Pleurochrysis_carterae.AAC.2